MTAYRKALPGVPVLALVAIAGLGSLTAWLLLRPEVTLRRSFEAALTGQRSVIGDVAIAEKSLDRQHLWLSRSDDQPIGSTGSIEVGARIEISDRDGRARRLEVVDVRRIELDPASAGERSPHLIMVSCREVGAPGKGVIRFLMDAAPLEVQTHRITAQKAL